MSDLTNFLIKNRDNRGVFAALRQGLVPTTEMRAWPYLAKFGGIGDNRKSRSIRTVAGLFALHPLYISTGNIGSTCLELCKGTDEDPLKTQDPEGKPIPPGPIGRKFGWLLSADQDEIYERVIRIVLFAKSKEVPINYDQLEHDLINWPKRNVREAWASSFWSIDNNYNKETKI